MGGLIADLKSIAARIAIDRERGVLVGSRCPACGAASWPARGLCFRCGSEARLDDPFAATGALLTYATVWVSRPGIPAPYVLGQVRLDDGPTLFAHVRGLSEEAAVPVRMRLVLGAEHETPAFWFQPQET